MKRTIQTWLFGFALLTLLLGFLAYELIFHATNSVTHPGHTRNPNNIRPL